MKTRRLELINKNGKIVFGRTMWGYCEIGDLVQNFFRIAYQCGIDTTNLSLRMWEV